MSHTNSIKTLLQDYKLIDTTVVIKGWVRNRRDSKAGISFVTISDGSCFNTIQAVVPSTIDNYQSEVLKLTKDCSVAITGKLIESKGKGQAVEIEATEVSVIGWIDEPDTYPMSPKRHSMEHLREYAHLRPRTNIIGAVTRVRSCLAQSIHEFFAEQGFFWVNTPIITASDCEGAGDLFRVSTLDLNNLPKNAQNQVDFSKDFFGKEAFLTVSGQLNAESYCLAMSQVYTFGPTFRAENSNTSRHLAEFWMLEPEIAFADLKDSVQLADKLLKYVVKKVMHNLSDDIEFFNKWVDKTCLSRLQAIVDTPVTHMEYSEAIELLLKAKQKFEFPVKWGLDLQSEHERYLCEKVVNGPIALMNYPKEIKAFYMRLNDDNKTVAAMDLLVPGVGELIGGSQREERLDVLDKRIIATGMQVEDYSWYRDLRRYGTVPHAGFGLGFERLINYITGIANIRDVVPFPRVPGNASF